jgi:hypothetical protein
LSSINDSINSSLNKLSSIDSSINNLGSINGSIDNLDSINGSINGFINDFKSKTSSKALDKNRNSY